MHLQKKRSCERKVVRRTGSSFPRAVYCGSCACTFLDGKLGGLIGGTGLFAMLLSAYGFALGLSSFSEENRKHRTSMIGSILNGVILVIWLGLFYQEYKEWKKKND